MRSLSDFKGQELITRVLALMDQYKPLHLSIVGGDPHPRAATLHLRSSGVPAIGETLLLYRVDEIAREQVSALRTRAIVDDFVQRKRQGSFVSLRSEVSRIGPDAYRGYCARVEPSFQVPAALIEMLRSIRTSLDRFDEVESLALMYHAYMMTDAFLWCYRGTFSEEFKISDSEIAGWLIRFTPELVALWSRVLARSASTWRLR